MGVRDLEAAWFPPDREPTGQPTVWVRVRSRLQWHDRVPSCRNAVSSVSDSDLESAPARALGGVSLPEGTPLRATYRVQLTPESGFEALRLRAAYLARLGVSHVYVSPCLEAVPGSTHGYDVTDPARVRQDYGGEAAAAAAFQACREHGLAIMLDIVPNHMAASPQHNPWWRDLLRWGRQSPFAGYFDVDWTRHEGRVLLPILGVSPTAALEGGEVGLAFGAHGLELGVGQQRLPIAARSLSLILGELAPVGSALAAHLERLDTLGTENRAARSELEATEAAISDLLFAPALAAQLTALLARINGTEERLQLILEAQYYRLQFWRAGLGEINYRRFFDVSDLAALRVEVPEVFDAAHVQIRRWLEQGQVSALRVDHPDGLKDPEQYFERLRQLAGKRWVVAEKILEPGERLPTAWQVDGSTGYDFMNVAGRLFVDSSAEAALTATYCQLAELPSYDFARSMYAAKGRALRELFGAEVAALTARALPVCQSERGRSFSAGDVQRALVALITGLPVYRTYLRPGQPATESDRHWLELARRHAVRELPELEPIVGRLVELLLGRGATPRHDEFATSFQQLAGPAMAKGLEDTVFYADARLLALNEVGGDPAHFGGSVEEFHQHCRDARAHWPRTLLASSTHDTKRSEDARLRIALLSELPRQWATRSEAWMRRARALPGGASVDPRTLYFLLQTLVGAWPISLERLRGYLLKAVREAKDWTSWLSPDLTREAALAELARALLSDELFGAEMSAFIATLQPAFERHSLALCLLKLTAPGVPDIYQGSELWDFSLADPDNRRAVDYALRERLLEELAGAAAALPVSAALPGGAAQPTEPGALDGWPERLLGRSQGEVKMWTILRALAVRRSCPECFDERGMYTALAVVGEEQHRVVAFQRGTRVVSIAPRLTFSLAAGWRGTRVVLPAGRFHNVLTGEWVQSGSLEHLLARFPVALLVGD
jgi:(1->4)-alpha-D-glucan 1-alpha-D-glucosylmutase